MSLLIISALFRQQEYMHENRIHRIDGRIVSISQPHVRPIVRGKAGGPVEFGAKLSLSLVEGYARIEHFAWDNFNEGLLLSEHLDSYYQRHGYYPESIHVDKIYRNRANRQLCKELDIRMSGPLLGRPSKEEKVNKSKRKQRQQDLRDRVIIEGKFGESKRRYGLNRIMVKLPDTSETVAGIITITMNLEKRLRILWRKIFGAFSIDQMKNCQPI